MVGYFAPDCNHYSQRDSCKFFRFPHDEKTFILWEKNIRRQDKPAANSSRICSCHFLNHDKNNGPTIFPRNLSKIFTFSSPEKSRRKRHSNKLTDSEPQPSTSQSSCTYLSELETQSEEIEESRDPFFEETQQTGTSQNVVMEIENCYLKQQVVDLNKLITHKNEFSFNILKENEKALTFYTGLPNLKTVHMFFSLFMELDIKYYMGWNVVNISREDQILLTLMKLKLNLKYEDLSYRFGCSGGTVSNIVLTWIHVFHHIIFQKLMDTVPTQRKNQCCLPQCFATIPNCRMVLDCTEVNCDVPHSMANQKATYSSYKHHNTLKSLVGVAPNGVLTFVSKLFPGSTSDKEIVRASGVLQIFDAGDLILADKGFLIGDILPAGVSLNVPPFLTTPQFTPAQVYRTLTVARARIHVERAINRIKNFDIVARIPQNLFKHASVVWQSCAALTNFQYPLINEVAELYNIKE